MMEIHYGSLMPDINTNKKKRGIQSDRRTQTFRSVIYSLFKSRRKTPRRDEEKALPFYTDVYERRVIWLATAIIALCLIDSMLTLRNIKNGGSEVNPFMQHLLDIGTHAFIIGKLLITGAGLLVAVLHINFHFLNMVPMRRVLTVLFGFYVLLIIYELILLSF